MCLYPKSVQRIVVPIDSVVKLIFRLIFCLNSVELSVQPKKSFALSARSFLMVCINSFYPVMIHFLADQPTGSLSVYHIVARNGLLGYQITGNVYCIFSILSRFVDTSTSVTRMGDFLKLLAYYFLLQVSQIFVGIPMGLLCKMSLYK